MTNRPPIIGHILLAHGSPDPLWRIPIEQLAQRVAARSPHTPVRCAYLDMCAPNLPDSAAELVSLGCTQLHVTPLFFGMGKHARHDVPELLAALAKSHPQVQVVGGVTVGDDPVILDALADLLVQRLS